MIKVKNVEIDGKNPKICSSIVENRQEDILEMGEKLMMKKSVDIIEWRIDFYEECFDTKKVLETAALLRVIVNKKPILATFRTKKEGGEKSIEQAVYKELIISLAISGYIDMADVEVYFMDKAETKQLIDKLKKNVAVVGSYHDFDKTPSCSEIYERIEYMREVGADIPKIACMPISEEDVFNLMKTTGDFAKRNKDAVVVAMSMGKMGKISRMAGKSFGSAITFGCLGKASAPGQINVDDLRNILDILND